MHKISFNNTNYIEPASATTTDMKGYGLPKDAIPVFSGKTALALVLQYYRDTGRLKEKISEVLVPPWMGYWIYMTMHKYCFPTMTMATSVSGLLLYHQWGFPQHVEEIMSFAKKYDLFVIEDCAHGLGGTYKGKPLGSFGNAAIFSFAKFFPCVVGGAIDSRDPALLDFVAKELKTDIGKYEREAFAVRQRFDAESNTASAFQLEQSYAIYDRLRACDPRALAVANIKMQSGALEKRRTNAARLKDEFMKQDPFGLFSEEVIPWIMPLFFEEEKMERVVKALREQGIESGIFHFDVRRNMLNSDYRKCVAVPCHDGVSENDMERIVRLIHDA